MADPDEDYGPRELLAELEANLKPLKKGQRRFIRFTLREGEVTQDFALDILEHYLNNVTAPPPTKRGTPGKRRKAIIGVKIIDYTQTPTKRQRTWKGSKARRRTTKAKAR